MSSVDANTFAANRANPSILANAPAPSTPANNTPASSNPNVNTLNAARAQAVQGGTDPYAGNLKDLASYSAGQQATPVVTTTTPLRAQTSQDSAKLDAMTANKQNQPSTAGAAAAPIAPVSPAKSTTDTSASSPTTATTATNLTTPAPAADNDPNSVANLTAQQNQLIQQQQTNADAQYSALKSANDATYGNAITSAQNQYAQLKQQAQQNQDAYMASVNNAGYSSQAFRYTPQITAGTIYNAEQAGITKMQTVQSQLDGAIAAAGAARDSGNLQAFGQYMASVDKINDSKLSLIQDHIKSAQTLQDKLDSQNRDIAVGNAYSSGTTDPTMILQKLKDSGDTKSTLADVTASIKAMNPEIDAINTIASDAAKQGAPASVIAAITGSHSASTAIAAAGTYLQSSSDPVMEGYLYYSRQADAQGLPKESFADYQAQQDYNKSYSDAKGKADAAGGTSGGVSGTTSVAIRGDGTADPVSQQQFLANLPGGATGTLASQIKGLANYTINPADWSSRAGKTGLSRADAVALAQQYNPTYSDTNYPAAAKYMASLKETTPGSTGGNIAAANTAINHYLDFYQNVTALGNGSSGLGNAISNKFTSAGFGNKTSNLAGAEADRTALADQLAKFFKGGGTSDSADIQRYYELLNPNQSPAKLEGNKNAIISLLQGQLDTSYADYRNALGTEPPPPGQPGSIISSASLNSLKALGVDTTAYEQGLDGDAATQANSILSSEKNAQSALQAITDPKMQKAAIQMAADNPNLTHAMIAQILGIPFNNVGADTNQGSGGGNGLVSINIPSGTLAATNNNPGNLRYAGQAGAQPGKGGFAAFTNATQGFNALVHQVAIDAGRGLDLAGFIGKFAPPTENNTIQYIRQVAANLGIKPNTPLSQINHTQLAKAIALKESSTIIG